MPNLMRGRDAKRRLLAGVYFSRTSAGLRPPGFGGWVVELDIRELLTHTAGFSYNFINNPRLVDAYREARVTDGLDQPEVSSLPIYFTGSRGVFSRASAGHKRKSLVKIGEVSLKTRFASKRGEFSSNGPQSRCSARSVCSLACAASRGQVLGSGASKGGQSHR